ncbi:MAG: hypothetical protein ABJH04_07555 [Cyclobacteriaceae bacterium]
MARKTKIKEASQKLTQTNVRLPKKVRDNTFKLGYEITEGIIKASNIHYFCGRATLNELKGKFTKGELSQLAKAQHNRTLPADEHLHSIRNYLAFLEDLIDQNQIQFTSKRSTLEKIKALTSHQICILREEIDIAWKKYDANQNNNDIDKLIENLT